MLPAVQAARPPRLDLLLARGADPNVTDARYHATPLGWACHAKRAATAARLLPLSRDVWALAYYGHLARPREVLTALPELARQLRPGGYTPLWWLADDEDVALAAVELLLAAGADRAHRNDKGTTAADWARKIGMLRVASKLGISDKQ